MTCLTCEYLNLQRYREHAKCGFGRCALETMPGVLVSIQHNCKKYVRAPDEIVEKRETWAEKTFKAGAST